MVLLCQGNKHAFGELIFYNMLITTLTLPKDGKTVGKNNTTALIFDQTLPEDPEVLSLNGFNHNY